MGIKASEYAIHRGVSKAAVSKAIKLGRIALLDDGSIDPELADKQWAGSVSRVNLSTKAPKQKSESTVSIDPVASEAEIDSDSVYRDDIPDSLTLTEAKTRHEILKARKAQMDLIKERGELTDVALVNKRLFTVAREIRDHWINWVNQISGEMAAELKVDQHTFTIMLEKRVKESLCQLADTDFQIVL